MTLNPFLCIDLSISDSLRSVRKSVLIYETIIKAAEMHFARLSKLEQDNFKEYPIYHFWKDKKN